jgi:hypothetical protein
MGEADGCGDVVGATNLILRSLRSGRLEGWQHGRLVVRDALRAPHHEGPPAVKAAGIPANQKFTSPNAGKPAKVRFQRFLLLTA